MQLDGTLSSTGLYSEILRSVQRILKTVDKSGDAMKGSLYCVFSAKATLYIIKSVQFGASWVQRHSLIGEIITVSTFSFRLKS